MNENENVFQKIKRFFSNIFSSKKLLVEGKKEPNKKSAEVSSNINKIENSSTNKEKSIFVEAEENRKLLDLQKQYIQGKIEEDAMTEEQIVALEKLFNEQIARCNQETKNTKNRLAKALLDNKEVTDLFKKYQRGEIKEEQMTEKQVSQIEFLYKMQIDRVKRETEMLKKGLA